LVTHLCIVTFTGNHVHSEPTTPKENEYILRKRTEAEEWGRIFGSKDVHVQLRVDIDSDADFKSVLRSINRVAQVNFIMKEGQHNQAKYIYCKRFICHHGVKNCEIQSVSEANSFLCGVDNAIC